MPAQCEIFAVLSMLADPKSARHQGVQRLADHPQLYIKGCEFVVVPTIVRENV